MMGFDKTFLFDVKSTRKEKGAVKEKNRAKGKGMGGVILGSPGGVFPGKWKEKMPVERWGQVLSTEKFQIAWDKFLIDLRYFFW
ncbi:MAG: hypothetical protein HY787_07620 [Deltaproteobacteria bacterium]|nr:hypothetical protein [Deltaproteobacteria bacterium]